MRLKQLLILLLLLLIVSQRGLAAEQVGLVETDCSGQIAQLIVDRQPIIKIKGSFNGLTVSERITLVAERLRQHTAAGINYTDFAVEIRGNLVGVTYHGNWLISADPQSAYQQVVTQRQLAKLWCENLRAVYRAVTIDYKVTAVFNGTASWYGKEFRGRRTANGESFDEQKFTAAHRSLSFGTRVRVTNLRNNQSVIVVINDRGPWVKHRLIDLSWAAARSIGINGVASVKVEVLEI